MAAHALACVLKGGKSMTIVRGIWRVCILLVGVTAGMIPALAQAPLATVAHVDLTRYAGQWYEIARYPNRFERKCDRNVTATYTLRPGGRIGVENACLRSDGSRTVARGWARVADPQSSAKLKVTFFWPFFGNYWILDLSPDYRYAVVGEPGRNYLWILSRTPQMDPELYAGITSRLAGKGYDAARLVRVRQSH